MSNPTPLAPASRIAPPPDSLAGLLSDIGSGESHPGWRRDALARAEAMARAAAATIRAQAERIARLERLALTDEMTGLLNRRGIEGRLEERLSEARRHGEAGVVMFFDLNGLKRLNDTFGHAAGDEAIRLVGHCLKRAVRTSDSVGRLGGDEFAVVMPRCDAGYGLSKAAKMGQAVARLVLDWQGERIPLSASVGLASFTGHEQATALLAEADAAMYRDKRAVKGAA